MRNFETYEGWHIAALNAGLKTKLLVNPTIEDPMRHHVAYRESYWGDMEYYGAFTDSAGDGPTGGLLIDNPRHSENEIFGLF